MTTDPTEKEEAKVDDRSESAKAMSWASNIIGASLTLAAPPLIGSLVDSKFQLEPICLIGGMLFGLLAGGWQFYQLIVALSKQN